MPVWLNSATRLLCFLNASLINAVKQQTRAQTFRTKNSGKTLRFLGAHAKGKHNGEKALALVLTPAASKHKLCLVRINKRRVIVLHLSKPNIDLLNETSRQMWINNLKSLLGLSVAHNLQSTTSIYNPVLVVLITGVLLLKQYCPRCFSRTEVTNLFDPGSYVMGAESFK